MPDTTPDISQLAWIAVDWGTTHLRAWAISAEQSVLASASSDNGMGNLEPCEFEPALLDLVSNWLDDRGVVPVLACGMVGARQGWVEADYLPVPTQPLIPDLFQPVRSIDHRLQVRIVPGLKQYEPPDVMRGEETQIAGFLSNNPQFHGVICMPGTHTKWVQISQGEVLSFHSYMTGEVFSLLERQSVLRHSLVGDAVDHSVFEATLQAVIKDPTLAVSGLFGLRADDLLNATDASKLRTKLSAYLIGSEVHAATTDLAACDIEIIGEPELTSLYNKALIMKGFAPNQLDAAALTLRGLFAARALLRDKKT